MLPRQCPKCGGTTETDGKHCSCGWTATPRKEAAEDRQCAYVELGVRCTTQGHLSRSVRGGPWYCGPHFWMVNGWEKQEALERKSAHMQRIRELLARKAPDRPAREPGEDEREAA